MPILPLLTLPVLAPPVLTLPVHVLILHVLTLLVPTLPAVILYLRPLRTVLLTLLLPSTDPLIRPAPPPALLCQPSSAISSPAFFTQLHSC
jgi:hypothetical protein